MPIYTPFLAPYGNSHAVAARFLLLGTATGLGQAAVRFFSAYKLRSGLSSYYVVVFGSVASVTLTAAAASAGVLVLFRPFIPSDLAPLLWAALVLYIFSSCNATLMDVLRGQEQSRWYSIIWTACYGGITWTVLVLGFGGHCGT